jgi:hypothetical protein
MRRHVAKIVIDEIVYDKKEPRNALTITKA